MKESIKDAITAHIEWAYGYNDGKLDEDQLTETISQTIEPDGFKLVHMNDIYEINGCFYAGYNRLKGVRVIREHIKDSVEKDQVLSLLKEGKEIISKYL